MSKKNISNYNKHYKYSLVNKIKKKSTSSRFHMVKGGKKTRRKRSYRQKGG